MNKQFLFLTNVKEEYFSKELHKFYTIITKKKDNVQSIISFFSNSFSIVIDASTNFKLALSIAKEIIQKEYKGTIIVLGNSTSELEPFRNLGILNLYKKEDKVSVANRIEDIFYQYIGDYERDVLYKLAGENFTNLNEQAIIDVLKKRIQEYVNFDLCTIIKVEKDGINAEVLMNGIKLSHDDFNQYLKRIFNTYQNLLHKEYTLDDLTLNMTQLKKSDVIPYGARKFNYLVLPFLISGYKAYGLIEITSLNRFLKHDVRLFFSIVNQASQSLENSILYNKIEKANEKLKKLNESKTDVLRICAHEIKTPLLLANNYLEKLLMETKTQIAAQKTDALF